MLPALWHRLGRLCYADPDAEAKRILVSRCHRAEWAFLTPTSKAGLDTSYFLPHLHRVVIARRGDTLAVGRPHHSRDSHAMAAVGDKGTAPDGGNPHPYRP